MKECYLQVRGWPRGRAGQESVDTEPKKSLGSYKGSLKTDCVWQMPEISGLRGDSGKIDFLGLGKEWQNIPSCDISEEDTL